VKSRTSAPTFSTPASSPADSAATTASIQPAIRSMSAVVMPREVTAAVPMRMPDGSNGLRGSKGTEL
jgi:hypothetical protein